MSNNAVYGLAKNINGEYFLTSINEGSGNISKKVIILSITVMAIQVFFFSCRCIMYFFSVQFAFYRIRNREKIRYIC